MSEGNVTVILAGDIQSVRIRKAAGATLPAMTDNVGR